MKPTEPNEKLTDVPDGWDELELFQRIQYRHLSADAGLPVLGPGQMRDFSAEGSDELLFRTVYDKFSAGLVSPEGKSGDSPSSR